MIAQGACLFKHEHTSMHTNIMLCSEDILKSHAHSLTVTHSYYTQQQYIYVRPQAPPESHIHTHSSLLLRFIWSQGHAKHSQQSQAFTLEMQ